MVKLGSRKIWTVSARFRKERNIFGSAESGPSMCWDSSRLSTSACLVTSSHHSRAACRVAADELAALLFLNRRSAVGAWHAPRGIVVAFGRLMTVLFRPDVSRAKARAQSSSFYFLEPPLLPSLRRGGMPRHRCRLRDCCAVSTLEPTSQITRRAAIKKET